MNILNQFNMFISLNEHIKSIIEIKHHVTRRANL